VHTLTGAYIHDNPKAQNATLFGTCSLQKRLEKAREGGAKLHKEIHDESIVPTETGLSIAWQNIVHQEGAWPYWSDHQEHDATYRALLLGDRRFHVVGDQTSTLPGWQEGAMMSAEHVIDLISGNKRREQIPEDIKAPDTVKITQGLG
jgi:monoamine oxidase